MAGLGFWVAFSGGQVAPPPPERRSPKLCPAVYVWVCSGQLLMCVVDLDMHAASSMGGQQSTARSQKTKSHVCWCVLSKQQLPVLKFQFSHSGGANNLWTIFDKAVEKQPKILANGGASSGHRWGPGLEPRSQTNRQRGGSSGSETHIFFNSTPGMR